MRTIGKHTTKFAVITQDEPLNDKGTNEIIDEMDKQGYDLLSTWVFNYTDDAVDLKTYLQLVFKQRPMPGDNYGAVAHSR